MCIIARHRLAGVTVPWWWPYTRTMSDAAQTRAI
jgi:hypothetical protein